MRNRILRAKQRIARIDFCLNRGAPIDKKRAKELKSEKAELVQGLKKLQEAVSG